MRESVTYQAIVEEGRQEGRQEGELDGVRHVLLRQGSKRFGMASEAVRAALNAITSLDALDALTDRIADVESWAELLGLP